MLKGDPRELAIDAATSAAMQYTYGFTPEDVEHAKRALPDEYARKRREIEIAIDAFLGFGSSISFDSMCMP